MSDGKKTQGGKNEARSTTQKRHQREKSKSDSDGQTLAPSFQLFRSPFEELNDDQLRQTTQEIANRSDEEYEKSLIKLRDLLRSTNPLQVLAYVSFFGLTARVDETEGVLPRDDEKELLPFQVEILQAISLQIDPGTYSGKPLDLNVLMQIWNNLQTLCAAHSFRRFDPARLDLPDEAKSITLAQELIRGTTRAVRNWGYHSQVKRIARELYLPFDTKLQESWGFTCSQIIDLFEKMLTEVESRYGKHVKVFANLLRTHGHDKIDLVTEYGALIGFEEEETKQYVEYVEKADLPLDGVHAMLVAHYNLRLPSLYTFNTAELAEPLGLYQHQVGLILDEYALEWGALSDFETEHLHLANPVWEKPVIKIGNSAYYCVLPTGFFSFVIPCVEAVLTPFATSVSDQRAEYLESKVAEIVERRFPGSNTKRNFKWEDDGTTYETDLVTFIDSFALVIECKSGKVTPPALRGAPERLQKHIQELLIDPNVQSSRLKKRIEFLCTNPKAEDPIRQEIGYDLTKVRNIVRVSVSLEDLGTIQTGLKQFEDTGWLPEDFVPCPTMNLADFETVFDILEHPVQILHYLMKREEIETSVNYFAHELHLLGLYLTTLLNIDDVDPNVEFILTDMSAPLDAYYDSLDAGVEITKPQPVISELFSSIFAQLEQRRPERWTEIGVALNMLSPDDQVDFTNMLSQLEPSVHKNWRTPGHKNVLIYIPQKSSSYALAYVMFKNGNAAERRDFVENAIASALDSDHVRTVVVIAKNIDGDERAYDIIALSVRRS